MSRPRASTPTATLTQIHQFRCFFGVASGVSGAASGCGVVVDISQVGRLLACPRGRITRTG